MGDAAARRIAHSRQRASRGVRRAGRAAPDVETAGVVRAQAAASLNILHILRAPLGGLFRHVLDSAQGQAERGHRVGLIVDSTTGGARADAALAELAPQLALGIAARRHRRELSPSDVCALSSGLARIRSAAPDVLHGHGAKGAALARLSAERAARHPRLHAPWRLAGLPARHARRRLLSHAGMAAEVAHRSVPVRERLHRQPVPRQDRPPAGHGARRAQRRRRRRVRADRAAAGRDRHRLRRRIAAGQSHRCADRGAGDAQAPAAA